MPKASSSQAVAEAPDPFKAMQGDLDAVLKSTSEWKILDAYQVIENEALRKRQIEAEKTKRLTFKKSLDEQLLLKSEKSVEAQLRRDDDDFVRTQSKLLTDWRDELSKTKRKVVDRYNEEKRVRDLQVAFRKEQKRAEFEERRARECQELAACKDAIETAKRTSMEKKEQERVRLLKIQQETAADRELRLERKRQEGLEDQRLMQEYKAKLQREEEFRASAFANRMKKLEKFGIQSSTEGAVKSQRDFLLRQEQLILAEAQKKERADIERERRDIQTKHDKARAMAEENRRLVQVKKQREAAFDGEERDFAERYVRESDDFLRDEATKFAQKRKAMVKHQEDLADQIVVAKTNNSNVEMDDRERQFNRQLLTKVTTDEAIREKIAEKLVSPAKSNKALRGSQSTGVIGF